MISNRLYFPLHSFNVNLKDLLPGSPSLVGRKPGIVKKACDRKVSRVRIPLPALNFSVRILSNNKEEQETN